MNHGLCRWRWCKRAAGPPLLRRSHLGLPVLRLHRTAPPRRLPGIAPDWEGAYYSHRPRVDAAFPVADIATSPATSFQKARELGPSILEFADELDATLRQPFSQEEMDTFERLLRSLVEVSD